jgi:hypothetical protein
MRKLAFIAVLLMSLFVKAQSTHSVSLSWTASPDATLNPTLTYNVYRAPQIQSACTATNLVYTKVGSTSSTLNVFTDSAVPIGQFCYKVTSTLNGSESIDSNIAAAVILPAPPTGVLVTATH